MESGKGNEQTEKTFYSDVQVINTSSNVLWLTELEELVTLKAFIQIE